MLKFRAPLRNEAWPPARPGENDFHCEKSPTLTKSPSFSTATLGDACSEKLQVFRSRLRADEPPFQKFVVFTTTRRHADSLSRPNPCLCESFHSSSKKKKKSRDAKIARKRADSTRECGGGGLAQTRKVDDSLFPPSADASFRRESHQSNYK